MEEPKKLDKIITIAVGGFFVVAAYPDHKKDLEMHFDVALDNNWYKIYIQDIVSSIHGHFQVRIKNAQRTVYKPGT